MSSLSKATCNNGNTAKSSTTTQPLAQCHQDTHFLGMIWTAEEFEDLRDILCCILLGSCLVFVVYKLGWVWIPQANAAAEAREEAAEFMKMEIHNATVKGPEVYWKLVEKLEKLTEVLETILLADGE